MAVARLLCRGGVAASDLVRWHQHRPSWRGCGGLVVLWPAWRPTPQPRLHWRRERTCAAPVMGGGRAPPGSDLLWRRRRHLGAHIPFSSGPPTSLVAATRRCSCCCCWSIAAPPPGTEREPAHTSCIGAPGFPAAAALPWRPVEGSVSAQSACIAQTHASWQQRQGSHGRACRVACHWLRFLRGRDP